MRRLTGRSSTASAATASHRNLLPMPRPRPAAPVTHPRPSPQHIRMTRIFLPFGLRRTPLLVRSPTPSYHGGGLSTSTACPLARPPASICSLAHLVASAFPSRCPPTFSASCLWPNSVHFSMPRSLCCQHASQLPVPRIIRDIAASVAFTLAGRASCSHLPSCHGQRPTALRTITTQTAFFPGQQQALRISAAASHPRPARRRPCRLDRLGPG